MQEHIIREMLSNLELFDPFGPGKKEVNECITKVF